jgi:hypothetical protein
MKRAHCFVRARSIFRYAMFWCKKQIVNVVTCQYCRGGPSDCIGKKRKRSASPTNQTKKAKPETPPSLATERNVESFNDFRIDIPDCGDRHEHIKSGGVSPKPENEDDDIILLAVTEKDVLEYLEMP